LPGVSSVAPHNRFHRLGFNASKTTCIPDKSRLMCSRQPFARPHGIPVSRFPRRGRNSRSIASRYPVRPFLRLVRFSTSNLARFRSGVDHHREPVIKDRTKRLPPVLLPSLPFGTFIPRDPHLSAATAVASGACARLGTCERTYRAESPDFSSLPVQLIADGSSFRIRYDPTGSLFRGAIGGTTENFSRQLVH
jgi:hypothetical protein